MPNPATPASALQFELARMSPDLPLTTSNELGIAQSNCAGARAAVTALTIRRWGTTRP